MPQNIIPEWTCPDCDYTTVQPEQPGVLALLESCAPARPLRDDLRHFLAHALTRMDEDLCQQRDLLYKDVAADLRATLDAHHAQHMEWLWTTARDHMVAALLHRDGLGFMHSVGMQEGGLSLVVDTLPVLEGMGLYEVCLLDALDSVKTNFHHWEESVLRQLIQTADRERLRLAGPVPRSAPLVLYRGVAGSGDARRERGLFWTSKLETAWWFARRFDHLVDPAVYTVVAQDAQILAYDNGRQEETYLLELPRDYPIERVTT
jgi:hypothetical protein